MKSTHELAKERLARLAEDLVSLEFPTSPLNVDDAHWLAQALQGYLNGRYVSLEKALGLIRPAGRSPGLKHRFICEVWAQSKDDLTAEQISEAVQLKYPDMFRDAPDPTEVRRAIGTLSRLPEVFLLAAEEGGWTKEARKAIASEITKRLKDKSYRT